MTKCRLRVFPAWFGFLFAVLASFFGASSPVYAQSQSDALSQCEAAAPTVFTAPQTEYSSCTLGQDVNAGSGVWGYYLQYQIGGAGFIYTEWFDFSGTPVAPPTCTAGQAVANGTTIGVTSSGEGVYQGCCLSMMLGGPSQGGYVETGSACPTTTGPTQPLQPASETSNPDGSKTWCDSISGKCVTYNPNNSGPAPAPASSSGTDWTSTTDNPASSSTSTITGTTTGSGGGSGGGTGSGSFSGTATTTNPASASSSAGKCDTGVCDVGNADGQIGSLYTPSTDTPQSLYASFAASVQSAPIVSAASGFFNVTAGGSCPTWSIAAIPPYMPALNFDFFCGSVLESALGSAAWIILAMAAYAAFRIAIY